MCFQSFLNTNIKMVQKSFLLKNKDLFILQGHIDGLVQDCSNSSALAMELLQSCTKPLTYGL